MSRSTHADDRGDVTGHEAMQRLLALRPRPDGVFCFNDPTAMGAMLAILDHGLKIPDDIAVIGCGDVHYAKFLRVPLTTISQQTEAMGGKAGQLALALIKAKAAGPRGRFSSSHGSKCGSRRPGSAHDTVKRLEIGIQTTRVLNS